MSIKIPSKSFFNHQAFFDNLAGVIANLFLVKDEKDKKIFINKYYIFWKGEKALDPFDELPNSFAYFNDRDVLTIGHDSLRFINDFGVFIYLHSLIIYLVLERLYLVFLKFVRSLGEECFLASTKSKYLIIKVPSSNAYENIDYLEVPVAVKSTKINEDFSVLDISFSVNVLVVILVQLLASDKAQLVNDPDLLKQSEINSSRLESAFNFVKEKSSFYLVSEFVNNSIQNKICLWSFYEFMHINSNNYSLDALINWVIITLMEIAVTNSKLLLFLQKEVFIKNNIPFYDDQQLIQFSNKDPITGLLDPDNNLFFTLQVPNYPIKQSFSLLHDFMFMYGEVSGLYIKVAEEFTIKSFQEGLKNKWSLELKNYVKAYFF